MFSTAQVIGGFIVTVLTMAGMGFAVQRYVIRSELAAFENHFWERLNGKYLTKELAEARFEELAGRMTRLEA